jgi:hypothetical protein
MNYRLTLRVVMEGEEGKLPDPAASVHLLQQMRGGVLKKNQEKCQRSSRQQQQEKPASTPTLYFRR